VLRRHLPEKEEWVIFVALTDFQRKLYRAFLTALHEGNASPNPVQAFSLCCKVRLLRYASSISKFFKMMIGIHLTDLEMKHARRSDFNVLLHSLLRSFAHVIQF
jgi:SNF2 family DNA or RNA helicase